MMKADLIDLIEFNKYLISMEEEKVPRQLVEKALVGLKKFIFWDYGRIMYMDKNLHINEIRTFGSQKVWNNVYMSFVSERRQHKYSVEKMKYGLDHRRITFLDWTQITGEDQDDFIKSYIIPQQLSASVGFGVLRPDGSVFANVMMDKIQGKKFTNADKDIIRLVVPHIRNLLNLLLYEAEESTGDDIIKKSILTKRENEISELLSKGRTPQEIASFLYISTNTVYRHIANIHNKLGVTNQIQMIIEYQRLSGKSR